MEYLLTVRIKFEAVDDAEARQKAKNQLDDFYTELPDCEIKFQRVKKDGPPEKVEL